jgi:DNA-binding LacI/PurR family transcriptional regulator
VTVSIRDVAAKAGVSIQTVSNVLNGRPGVSARTRQRVEEAVRELGYTRNLRASALRSGRPTGLGLLIATTEASFPSDAHQARILAGITEHLLATEEEVHPLLFLSRHEIPESVDLAPFAQGLVGVAIVALFLPKPACRRWVDTLEQSRWPCVILEQSVMADHLACVLSDQQQGALEATQHLLRQGHRRIALITASQGTGEIDERRLGYNRAMALWGLPAPERIIVETTNTIPGGYEVAREILKRPDRPTAILAVSDLLALGSIEAARTLGLRVPDDLAVVGFEDMEFAAHLDPALTSVRLPDHALGVAATRLALHYLHHGRFPQRRLVIPTSLHVRASSTARRDSIAIPSGHVIMNGPEKRPQSGNSRGGPFRIGVALASIDNPWRVSMHEQLQLAAARDPAIGELIIRDAQADVGRQAEDIRALLRAGIDALIVDPAGDLPLVPAVEEAWASNIPVVMLDAAVSTDRYTTKVGPDEVLVGKIAAEDLIERIGRGKIVIFEGPAGWPVVVERSRGMAMVLQQHRDVTVLATAAVPQWSRERAREIMREWLLLFPEINGVLAHDGLMAIGALEAAQEVGRAEGLRLGLIGTYNRALRYLAEVGEGKTVLIPTWVGAECIRVVRRILEGATVPKWWDMGIIVITKDNLADWYDPSKPGESFESLVHE